MCPVIAALAFCAAARSGRRIGTHNSNIASTTPSTALILHKGNDSGLPLNLIEILPRCSRLDGEYQNSCSFMYVDCDSACAADPI
jgi:hypothetical protein